MLEIIPQRGFSRGRFGREQLEREGKWPVGIEHFGFWIADFGMRS
jgi:hypothetical protein